MTKLLFLSLFVCFTQTIYAQKIDLDKRDVTIEQVLLPQNNALAKFNTYTVSLVFNPSEKEILGFSEEYLKNQLNLDGYNYVKGKADFLLKINVDKVTLLSEEVLEDTKEVKNSAGQMVKTTYYTGQLKYAINTTIQLIDNSTQTVIEEFNFAGKNAPVVLTTLVQTLKSDAEKFNAYNKKNSTNLNEKYKGLFSGHMNKIKSKYGYRIVSETDRFWEIDVKKAPEFAEFNQHLNNVLKALEALKAGDDVANARTVVAPDLAYWKENGAKVVAADKNMKKLKYAYYLNLSKAQYYLELLDECQENAKVIIENDYDENDGKELVAKSNAVKEMLKNAGAQTWHLSRLNASSKTYYNVSEDLNQLTLAETNRKATATPDGYFEFPGDIITINDVRRSGKLISKKDFSDDNIFSKTYGTTFIYEENGVVKRMGINPDSINSMDFGPDLKFSVYNFDNNQDMPVKRLIFKDISKNRKIQYLQYVNSNLDIANDLKITKNMIAMQDVLRHRQSGKMAAVGGWGNSAFRERTADFYAQFCPEMKDMILNNVFGNKNSLKEWQGEIAGYYLEKCQ
jgi:hypothetical protein